jgi:hypothetical protein
MYLQLRNAHELPATVADALPPLSVLRRLFSTALDLLPLVLHLDVSDDILFGVEHRPALLANVRRHVLVNLVDVLFHATRNFARVVAQGALGFVLEEDEVFFFSYRQSFHAEQHCVEQKAHVKMVKIAPAWNL